jgi:predicted transcriptional regulator
MEKNFMKRGRLEIIYEILSICQKPTQKTRILYGCNLSYEQLSRYMKYLTSRDLLCSIVVDEKKLYQVTEKGRTFLERYESLSNIIEEIPMKIR